ncbi:chemotaxis protein CheB [Massilia sp. IC2-476]|uniref:chemotaxis protein CheB n=1 Tax=Massilia sp. IC2-476 TaxID=2887199 RepID=UPI001D110188|nr:chemotaxis protein CheB [Massilia sp. IC2-476]MCC2974029.1 chemotaxis protein CheB [Massilia sp. IC2-476]
MNVLTDTGKRDIVVVGSSTGGIDALRRLFSRLPSDSGASFLVVQHLSAHSPSEFDRILQGSTRMRVAFASDRQQLLPNTVTIAAPDRHLMIEDGRIRVTRGPKECRARPSVDVLFRSAALAYGPRVIGVVLTGALDDGTAGLWQVKDRQGLAFVQDPDEAVCRSMPESVLEYVDVDGIGTIEALAARLCREIGSVVAWKGPAAPSARQQAEHQVGLEGNAMQAGVMELGKMSKYSCPECHGVLVQIEDGKLVRFRCHTGHAYSLKSLLADVDDAIDKGLWDAVRAIEERILILRQRADIAEAAGDAAAGARLRAEAERASSKYQPLRELVLDSGFFDVEADK